MQGSSMAGESQQKSRGSDAAEDVLQNTSKGEIEKLACGDIEVRWWDSNSVGVGG